MGVIADLIIRLRADTKSAESGLSSFSKRGVGGLAKVATGVIGVTGGMAALTAVVGDGISEWEDSTKIQAQTAAVLKSTGGVAGVTAKQVDNLSTAIMNKTGIDDEAVKSAENLLLTFTNIRNEAGKGNDIFTQATKITEDMSVALGEDGSSAAIQLGKALNDPIKGITALQRVGVSFTAGQRKQIKALVDSGRTMDAQKLILRELNKEFGGSAEAVGKTLPGKLEILKQKFNNFAGDLVGKTIPYLMKLVSWVQTNWPEISATFQEVVKACQPFIDFLVSTLRNAFDVMEGIFKVFHGLITGDWSELWDGIKQIFGGVWNEIVAEATLYWTELKTLLTGIWNGLSALAGVVWGAIQKAVDTAWNEIKTLTSSVWDGIKTILTTYWSAWQTLATTVFGAIKTTVDTAWNAIKTVSTTVWNGVKTTVTTVWNGLRTAASTAWNAIKTAITTPINAAKTAVTTAVNAVKGTVTSVFSALSGAVRGEWNGIKSAITGAINAAKSVVVGAVNAIKRALNDTFNAFKEVPGKLKSLIVAPINGVIDLLNDIRIPGFHIHIPGIDTHIPGIGKIGDVDFGWGGFTPFHIPHLAQGGIVNEPTLALIGEAGPEAVVPLDRMPRGGVGGPALNVEGDLVIREEMDIDRVAARLGRRLAVAGL